MYNIGILFIPEIEMEELKKIGKRAYKKILTKVFEENAKIFSWYNYVYTWSLVLFLTLAYWKKIPDDVDVALDRNNKWVDDFIVFYHRLINHEGITDIKIKTVFGKTYTIDGKTYEVVKYQLLDVVNMEKNFLETLLEKGNIRICYYCNGIKTELFPEKNGNGLTNLWVIAYDIMYKRIKTEGWNLSLPLLAYKSMAQWYSMNFIKEIIWNNIYRFTDQASKPKDGIRLFMIISLLEKSWEDASPKWILALLKQTIAMYSRIPQERRSLYVDSAIQEYPWIRKMIQQIAKEFAKVTKKKHIKKYKFLGFYKKLSAYKKELNTYIDYLENDMLWLLQKDILGEKYVITDLVSSFSKKPVIGDAAKIERISQNLEKIIKDIGKVGIKNKNESFAYFYEMYMFKNLFIKPIKKALPETSDKFAK